MFINISPAAYNLEETVTTLVYGSKAKNIVNNQQKNVESKSQAKLNERFIHMQTQLDLALSELRKNNIEIPKGITVESTKEMNVEELKDEPPENLES